MLAVGGGGGPSGEDLGSGYGAGGSGYVVHQAIQMLGRSNNQFWVKVGSGGERGEGGEDTTIDWGLTPAYFRAQGGESGDGAVGGAGYSGGGGANGDGGSDGSDGCCGPNSGVGSGFNLSSIQLDTFVLSPGAGGEKYMIGGGRTAAGGGGGGVLVDGEGAQDNSIYPEYNGQGYGFGGGFGSGGQGVVLMEVITL